WPDVGEDDSGLLADVGGRTSVLAKRRPAFLDDVELTTTADGAAVATWTSETEVDDAPTHARAALRRPGRATFDAPRDLGPARQSPTTLVDADGGLTVVWLGVRDRLAQTGPLRLLRASARAGLGAAVTLAQDAKEFGADTGPGGRAVVAW